MKLLKNLSLALLLTVLLVGCSKNDDDNSASLIGSWKITSQKLNNVTLPLDACELKSVITFDSKYITIKDYYGDDCENFDTEALPYTRNGNNLTVGIGEEMETVKILTLSQSTLEIETRDEEFVLVQKYTRL
ncbi:hypothetical protein EI546_14395 [Aequorivita sp. H23M31]|uniref:Lipocalin-like domain-containing protein n=1 Tax=Aequorivita ciconiae TaxID=2494375 RepID=A0A410G6D9_9FLAO|nr:lipocalin family protein [Aequorivita sp. H23M31]QAA82833.1 hypothetical protein EI546_14395 [Aequorivita sp. H23M31]